MHPISQLHNYIQISIVDFVNLHHLKFERDDCLLKGYWYFKAGSRTERRKHALWRHSFELKWRINSMIHREIFTDFAFLKRMRMFNTTNVILAKCVYISREEILSTLSVFRALRKIVKLILTCCCHKQLAGFGHFIAKYLKLNKCLRF